MATDYFAQAEQRNAAYEKQQKELGETKKATLNDQLDRQLKQAEQEAELQVKELDSSYRSVVDTNAVQKELDKRHVKETLANLGLLRSGTHATQQTAIELSAGNKNAAALLQRQNAVDSLKQSLAEYKRDVENTRRETINEIDETVQNNVATYSANTLSDAMTAANKDYAAQLDYEKELAELKQKAKKEEEQAAVDNEKLYANKGYQFAGTGYTRRADGTSKADAYFKYYDSTANKMMTISGDELIDQLMERDGLSSSTASAFVDSLTVNAGNDYSTVRYGNGQENVYLTHLANALTLPQDANGIKIYNRKFGTKAQSARDVRRDYAQRILEEPGLTDTDKADIFNKAGFTTSELAEYAKSSTTQ